MWAAITKQKIPVPDCDNETFEYQTLPVKVNKPSYITELLEKPLNRAGHAGMYTVFDNEGNVQESANGLKDVAHEK